MTEEEYFRKNYPDSCYGDKPLSPHWDFFQDGVEFGERQSEKKIADLEKENSELKADNDARKFAMAMSEKVEKQLREENEKLKTDYEVLSCSVGDFGELQDKLEEEQRKNNGLSDNLTKAKEIIKDLLSLCEGETDSKLVFTRAEQFLKENV